MVCYSFINHSIITQWLPGIQSRHLTQGLFAVPFPLDREFWNALGHMLESAIAQPSLYRNVVYITGFHLVF